MTLRITTIIILLSTILYSCDNFKSKIIQDNHKVKSNLNTISLKNKLVDSLVKFSSLNEFLLRDDVGEYVLYSTEINGSKIGFIAITDSSLFFFQKFKNKWVINDSIPFDTYAFSYKVEDLNGDNKNDFIINSHPDVHGQSIPYVFICSDKNILKYRKDIKLHNIHYDYNTKLVRSYYESCAYCVHTKELYRWENDSLRITERVELDLTLENKISLRYYKKIKNKLSLYKTTNDEGDYEKALWVDECE